MCLASRWAEFRGIGAGCRCVLADMNKNARTVFQLNKTNILPFIVISLVFVSLGAWILSLDPDQIRGSGGRHNSPVVMYFFGVAAIVFFGSIAVSATIKLFGRKEGVVIDHLGITDNSSGVSAGFVPWSDIKRLRIRKGWLVVELVDPGKYLDRGWLPRRLVNRLNQRFHGSPIVISDQVLEGSVKDIQQAAEQYRSMD